MRPGQTVLGAPHRWISYYRLGRNCTPKFLWSNSLGFAFDRVAVFVQLIWPVTAHRLFYN